MKRRTVLIVVCAVAVLAAAVGIVSYIQTRPQQNKIASTDSGGYAILEVPPADPALVGKWRNTENPQWYKVYYDDYDGEGYFWGKEWNEADDVQEEDLNYHGNGWFRWRKDSKQLIELHTMDVQDVPIPKIWIVRHLSARVPNDSLVLTESDREKNCYHFSRM